jgi:hypothetical protein
MSLKLTEDELRKLGFMEDPDHPGQCIPVKEEEPPDETWPLEKLAGYITRTEERARRLHDDAERVGRLESVQRFRLGNALHLAHQKTPHGQWRAWLKQTFSFSHMTAWRAEEVFRKATDKYGDLAAETCGHYSINELYEMLDINPKAKPPEEEGEGERQGKGDRPEDGGGEGRRAHRPAAKGKGREQSQPGEDQGEGRDGDEDEQAGADAQLPDDPRRHAEKVWEQRYAAHDLIRIAADCLEDAQDRFAAMTPEEESLAGRDLKFIGDCAADLLTAIRGCQARREANP